MKLKWYGQASFRVTADDGTSIISIHAREGRL